jgi:hypothetical protein
MPQPSKRTVVVSYAVELDPREMAARGRLGGLTTHSRYDSRQLAHIAQEGLLSKFAHEIDPDGLLSAEERRERAKRARRVHMLRLARKSALARSARKEAADAVA